MSRMAAKPEVLKISKEGRDRVSSIEKSRGLHLISNKITASVSSEAFSELLDLSTTEKKESKVNNSLY